MIDELVNNEKKVVAENRNHRRRVPSERYNGKYKAGQSLFLCLQNCSNFVYTLDSKF